MVHGGESHPRAVAPALNGQDVTVAEDPSHLAPRAQLGNRLDARSHFSPYRGPHVPVPHFPTTSSIRYKGNGAPGGNLAGCPESCPDPVDWRSRVQRCAEGEADRDPQPFGPGTAVGKRRIGVRFVRRNTSHTRLTQSSEPGRRCRSLRARQETTFALYVRDSVLPVPQRSGASERMPRSPDSLRDLVIGQRTPGPDRIRDPREAQSARYAQSLRPRRAFPAHVRGQSKS